MLPWSRAGSSGRSVCAAAELTRDTLRFIQGHDAKLKACLRAVLQHRKDREEVPEIARAMKDHINFLKDRPELAKAL
jgi:hypothetical protein